MVIVNAVVDGCNDRYALIVIHIEELRLSAQRLLQNDQLSRLFGVEIQLHDGLLLREKDVSGISIMLRALEAELHADRVVGRVVLDINLFEENELVHGSLSIQILDPLEDEQLVWLLLIHYEVLARNDCQDLLILRDLHRDDLIRLPISSFLQWDFDLTLLDLLVRVDIVEFDQIAPCH